MKRFLAFAVTVCLFLAGCGHHNLNDLDQIRRIYQEKGYEIWQESFETREDGSTAVLKATDSRGDYIYFTFFDSASAANNHAKEINHPITHFFFSLLYSQPQWHYVKVQGSICIEYSNPLLYMPFLQA